jgi:hypothetical protein
LAIQNAWVCNAVMISSSTGGALPFMLYSKQPWHEASVST